VWPPTVGVPYSAGGNYYVARAYRVPAGTECAIVLPGSPHPHLLVQCSINTALQRRLRLAPVAAPTQPTTLVSSITVGLQRRKPIAVSTELDGLTPLARALGLLVVGRHLRLFRFGDLRPLANVYELFESTEYELPPAPPSPRATGPVPTSDAPVPSSAACGPSAFTSTSSSVLPLSSSSLHRESAFATALRSRTVVVTPHSERPVHAAIARVVMHAFLQNMPSDAKCVVDSIEVLLNFASECRYQQQVEVLKQAHQQRGVPWPGPDERLGFHGTTHQLAPVIVASGFKTTFSRKTQYGFGTYFSVTAGYSDAYARPGPFDQQKMFMARILVNGHTVTTNGQLGPSSNSTPTWIASKTPGVSDYPVIVGCDHMPTPSIFVCNDDASILPFCLITYRRI